MKIEQATFAAGCFWGVEAAFRRVAHVIATQVGYSGGSTPNPTYKDVCSGRTGHAEAVLVTFDSSQISYAELLDVFWSSHDPTTINRQGPDIGSQYRSIIFFHNDQQKQLAEASMQEVNESKVFKHSIVTQIVPANTFYPAEEYHQNYFEKQGTAAFCHTGIVKVHTKLAAKAVEARQPGTLTGSASTLVSE